MLPQTGGSVPFLYGRDHRAERALSEFENERIPPLIRANLPRTTEPEAPSRCPHGAMAKKVHTNVAQSVATPWEIPLD